MSPFQTLKTRKLLIIPSVFYSVLLTVMFINSTKTAAQFVDCPISQKTVKNGAKPDVELFKKLIKCKKGEKAVQPGEEGAVLVEVANLQIGNPRPWSYRQDTGSGTANTIVYPVKATYTVKILYRAATEVEEGWIRILNFYVNSFGEWQIGSEEPVQPAKTKRIPK